ncbi:RidA family protein [Subtercola sp. RTI3]|uniref:RidA family protein n=1 Tax=Subtercola sp. RTI3 TaxID=3048639 RepID=UPI002B2366B8|nr:RidA family protein [Subtercola sp. RTI3]MEA9985919.1 RidA family protein [Subtercola sp. RTI3]
MSTVSERLAELGIEIPAVSPPAGAYTPAVIAGSMVYTAGQLPFVNGVLSQTGKVGVLGGSSGASGAGAMSSGGALRLVDPSDAKAFAQTAAINALAAVQSVIGSLDRVTQVVKVTGFVASDPSFTGQPGVINGASEFLVDVFGAAGIHARSAVGVAVLPLDSPVEVELIVAFE